MQLDYQHNGGSCPIDGSQIVQVQFRNGKMASEALPAFKWRWSQWPEGRHDFDIVSYSIVGKPKDDGGTWTAVSGGYS